MDRARGHLRDENAPNKAIFLGSVCVLQADPLPPLPPHYWRGLMEPHSRHLNRRAGYWDCCCSCFPPGLTLIFSIDCGVFELRSRQLLLCLAAYFAYQITRLSRLILDGALIAPLVWGYWGPVLNGYGLRAFHQYGHVPELDLYFASGRC